MQLGVRVLFELKLRAFLKLAYLFQDQAAPARRFTTGQIPTQPQPSTDNTPVTSSSVQLSQDEVVHIRSVLNRAKMDEVDDSLKSDIATAKVCFRCTKVKFNFLNWKYACRLCNHSFCSACSVKVSCGCYFETAWPIKLV